MGGVEERWFEPLAKIRGNLSKVKNAKGELKGPYLEAIRLQRRRTLPRQVVGTSHEVEQQDCK